MKIKVKDSLRVAKIYCLNEFMKEFPNSKSVNITILEENEDNFLILINSKDNGITFDYER